MNWDPGTIVGRGSSPSKIHKVLMNQKLNPDSVIFRSQMFFNCLGATLLARGHHSNRSIAHPIFPSFPLTQKIALPLPPSQPKLSYSNIGISKFGDHGEISFSQRHCPTVAELRVGAALTVNFALQTNVRRPAVQRRQ